MVSNVPKPRGLGQVCYSGGVRRFAVLGILVAGVLAACTFDGLDAYDHPDDAAADSTLDVVPQDVAQPDGGTSDAATDGPVQDACIGCLPIECADAGTCTAPAEICCGKVQGGFLDSGMGTLGGYACVSAGSCKALNEVPIACSGPESCSSGQVCCGISSSIRGGNFCYLARSTVCRTACNAGEFVVGCDASAACPTGTTCTTSTCTLPGFPICR